MKMLYIVEIEDAFGERRCVSLSARSRCDAVSRIEIKPGEVISSVWTEVEAS